MINKLFLGLAIAGVCSFFTAANAQPGMGPKRTITVFGTAEKSVEADEIYLSISLSEYQDDSGLRVGLKELEQRFLKAAGTDSSVPDDGFRAMQDKGPSYFYGGDSVAQRKIREKLASVGPFALREARGDITGGIEMNVMQHHGHVILAQHDILLDELRPHRMRHDLRLPRVLRHIPAGPAMRDGERLCGCGDDEKKWNQCFHEAEELSALCPSVRALKSIVRTQQMHMVMITPPQPQ